MACKFTELCYNKNVDQDRAGFVFYHRNASSAQSNILRVLRPVSLPAVLVDSVSLTGRNAFKGVK